MCIRDRKLAAIAALEAEQRADEKVAQAKKAAAGVGQDLDKARARLAEFEQRLSAQQKEMEARLRDAARKQEDGERQQQEMRRALEQSRREAEELRRAMEQSRREGDELRQALARRDGEADRREGERMAAVERLAAERREIEKLRDAVMADVARSRQQDPKPQTDKVAVAPQRLERLADELTKLRAENEQLKQAIGDLKRRLADGVKTFVDGDGDGLPDRRAVAGRAQERGAVATLDDVTPPAAKPAPQKWSAASPVPAPPMPPATAAKSMALPLPGGGSVTIENEHCEVHIHIHGDGAALKAAPQPAAGAPRSVRAVEVAPPPATPGENPPRTVRSRKAAAPAPAPTEPPPPPAPARQGGGDEPAAKPPTRNKAKEPAKERPPGGGAVDAPPTDDELLQYVLGLLLTTR